MRKQQCSDKAVKRKGRREEQGRKREEKDGKRRKWMEEVEEKM